MEAKPDYLAHRKRLRERFQKNGSEGMLDYEILELLLTYAIPRKDVKPVAKELIRHFGGLSGVLDASQEELETVLQIGPISSTLIRLVKEICGAYLAEYLLKKGYIVHGIKRRSSLFNTEGLIIYIRIRMLINEISYFIMAI
jgi:DNA repair protein RadC